MIAKHPGKKNETRPANNFILKRKWCSAATSRSSHVALWDCGLRVSLRWFPSHKWCFVQWFHSYLEVFWNGGTPKWIAYNYNGKSYWNRGTSKNWTRDGGCLEFRGEDPESAGEASFSCCLVAMSRRYSMVLVYPFVRHDPTRWWGKLWLYRVGALNYI